MSHLFPKCPVEVHCLLGQSPLMKSAWLVVWAVVVVVAAAVAFAVVAAAAAVAVVNVAEVGSAWFSPSERCIYYAALA